ncbi:hypothetical protein EI94DRAFT_1697134 [Lactarius quietus]|nr:hypothetical protein EI94DRAFT_1705212 [Lactarius quietus]KAF8272742.1 hypothetical protein EI94DRAFT_1697134 [Lactarius quietus]
MAIAAVKANGLKHSSASTKEAHFIIILNILNEKPQKEFFTQLETERAHSWRDHLKDNQDQTKPARKGSQNTDQKDTHPHPPTTTPPPPASCMQAITINSHSQSTPDRPQTTSMARKDADRQIKRPPPPLNWILYEPTPAQAFPTQEEKNMAKVFKELEMQMGLEDNNKCKALLKEILNTGGKLENPTCKAGNSRITHSAKWKMESNETEPTRAPSTHKHPMGHNSLMKHT